MNNELEEIDLNLIPLTMNLLIDYLNVMYEESADLSDESLRSELLFLAKNNQLEQLIITEAQINSGL